jgi:glycosyltransferase involved in cell wall biosynthesis
MWPFTGGCHYAAACLGFKGDCSACPQLRDTHFGITDAILRDKKACLPEKSLTIVTCSNWLKKEAEQSALFNKHRIECIHNGLDTSIFSPEIRPGAKTEFGIDENDIVLMFGATHGRSVRKGFDLLAGAIAALADDTVLSEWLGPRKLVVLSMGHPSKELEKLPVSVCNVGYKHNDSEVARVYGAADIFVLPSREDNLPNTVMEAMACGCVPVAFDIGGVGDLYQEGVQGHLISPFDVMSMAAALKHLIMDEQKRNAMGVAATDEVNRRFTQQVQAQRYLELYEELVESDNRPFASGFRARYTAPLNPYPSSEFGGQGGGFFRLLLFSYYSTLQGQVGKTPTKTLLFILLRRSYRKLSGVPLLGFLFAAVRKTLGQTAVYGRLRTKLAPDVKGSD